MAVDAIVRSYDFEPYRARYHGMAARGTVAGFKLLVLKPSTFVNRSGRSVAAAARFHKIAPEDVIVIHDELDLRPAKVRVKQGGGPAGHNGLRSIDSHIGRNYWRVRIGIGHPGDPRRVEGYVLKNFLKADRAWLGSLLDTVAEAFPLLLEGKNSDFMSKIAMLAPPPTRSRASERVHQQRKDGDNAGPSSSGKESP